jgi:hypothetical protein
MNSEYIKIRKETIMAYLKAQFPRYLAERKGVMKVFGPRKEHRLAEAEYRVIRNVVLKTERETVGKLK